MATRARIGTCGRQIVARLLAVCWAVMVIACGGCGEKNQASSKPQGLINGAKSEASYKPQDLILGDWTWTGNFRGKVITVTNDFGKDGVVKVVQDGIPLEVNYRLVDENQIDYGTYGRSRIVSITKDTLDIIGNDGVRRTWTRP